MEWRWQKFADLSGSELYEIIRLRERVFVVEQRCAYLDCDGYDPEAWHLSGYRDGQLVAYLRAFPPKIKYAEASFGRVVTAPEARGSGCGKALTALALGKIAETFGSVPLRISAQAHLEKFYASYGFVQTSQEYLEDDIPHIDMLRAAPPKGSK